MDNYDDDKEVVYFTGKSSKYAKHNMATLNGILNEYFDSKSKEKAKKRSKKGNGGKNKRKDNAITNLPFPCNPILDIHSLQPPVNQVPDAMQLILYEDSGVFFGNIPNLVNLFVGKSNNHDGHIMVVGGPGSGKGSCIINPTYATWQGPIISIDIKSGQDTLWHSRKARKRPAKVFDLTGENPTSSTYDPFYYILQNGKSDLLQNVRELVQAIIQLPIETREPFWIESAQDLLTAEFLYFIDIGSSFVEAVTAILNTKPSKLITEISNSNNVAARIYISHLLDNQDISDSKLLTGINAELRRSLTVFGADLRVRNALTRTRDSIKWEDIDAYDIFLSIPEARLEQWGRILIIMLTQLIKTLECRPDKYSSEGEKLPPILLLLDEFPRLGKLDIISNALATLRSKGVTICIFVQSIGQLDTIYGEHVRQTMVDCCSYQAILKVTEPIYQKHFSDIIGTIKTGSKSTGVSYNPYTEEMTSHNFQVSESREPVIYPHELAYLDDVLLIHPEGFCRVKKVHYPYKKTQNHILQMVEPKKSQEDT